MQTTLKFLLKPKLYFLILIILYTDEKINIDWQFGLTIPEAKKCKNIISIIFLKKNKYIAASKKLLQYVVPNSTFDSYRSGFDPGLINNNMLT